MDSNTRTKIQNLALDELRLKAGGFQESVEMELLLKSPQTLAGKDITVRLQAAHYEQQRWAYRCLKDREKLLQQTA